MAGFLPHRITYMAMNVLFLVGLALTVRTSRPALVVCIASCEVCAHAAPIALSL